jgi:ferrous iron transport protein A
MTLASTALGKLKKGTKAVVSRVGGQDQCNRLTQRLMEMGFLEGSPVEIVHQAPFGGDPMAVRIRGTLIALRRNEANAIEVISYE